MRKGVMKTTVIIPNYNGIKFIENCMTALKADDSCEYRICVVDNGSTDGSREWLEENCPRVQLLALGENTGFCGAVNAGIREAKTPYVILLNNDTEVVPGFVRGLESCMEKHPKAFSVSAKMLDLYHPELLDGAGDLYCALGWAFARGKGKPAATNYTKECEIFSACGGAAIYRRELVEQLGYFDEAHFAYLEDCDLGFRAQIHGYRNYYTPESEVLHAGSGASGSRYNEFKVRLSSRNSIYLIYKNMPLWQILLNSPLLAAGFLVKYLFFVKKGLGKTYRKGCMEGLRLCRTREGRERKRTNHSASLSNRLRIQKKLWVNLIRRITA